MLYLSKPFPINRNKSDGEENVRRNSEFKESILIQLFRKTLEVLVRLMSLAGDFFLEKSDFRKEVKTQCSSTPL